MTRRGNTFTSTAAEKGAWWTPVDLCVSPDGLSSCARGAARLVLDHATCMVAFALGALGTLTGSLVAYCVCSPRLLARSAAATAAGLMCAACPCRDCSVVVVRRLSTPLQPAQ